MKDNTVYLKHIRDAIYRIENYVADLERTDFISSVGMPQSAVVRELEVIGEAAKNVSEGFQQEHPEIPWRDMMDTRNKVIHEYMAVDYELVWDITEKALPSLKKALEDLVGIN